MPNSKNLSSKTSDFSATLSIGTSFGVILLLIALHFLSPEFDPSWRMVSEYANGEYRWVLSLLFILWAISSWALAFHLSSQLKTRLGKIGLFLLCLSGVGELMAAFFDINHSLHGVAAFIGIGSFPFAAFFISKELRKIPTLTKEKRNLLLVAHLPWISGVLMVGSFALLIFTFMQSGADLSGGPVSEIPAGVIAVVGWANRFLIIVYAACLAYLASLNFTKKKM